MTEKVSKKKSVEVHPIPFQNNNTINAQIDNTRKCLVLLQPKPKYPLHYVVYKISEANMSTPFNLLIRLKQNR